MDRPEGFLGRWSRLKAETEKHQAETLPEERPEAGSVSAGVPCPPVTEPQGEPDHEPPAEPPSLPPIESLGADSDYRPFLASGVPEELRRLAMRRAWVTDPKISGFRGFGEYDWDCNAPGYGRLLATDDVGRLLDAVCRTVEREPSAEAGETMAEAGGEMRPDGEPAPLPPPQEEPLAQSDEPRRAELPQPGDETSDVRKC